MLLQALRSLSIRAQLIALALLVATLALTITGIALIGFSRAQQREEFFNELSSLTTLLANRSAAAMAFLDDKTAQENLLALKSLPHIAQACMFDAEGILFSRYAAHTAPPRCSALLPLDTAQRHLDNDVISVQIPIMAGDAPTGALRIITTAAPWAKRQEAQQQSLLVALGGAMLAALLLGLLLARTVSAPILRIRELTRKIISSQDFSLRAPDLGSNEIGELAHSVNAMLGTIEQQNLNLIQRIAYAKRLFYDSPVAQILLDPDSHTVTDCNTAAASAWGLTSREDLIGQDLTALTLSAAKTDSMTSLHSEATQQGRARRDWHFKRGESAEWDGELTAILLELGEKTFIHLSVQDVTERKLAASALLNMNQELESRVSQRTSELANANHALQEAISSLKHTQQELIQQEKLASLGSLVAGIAHELNTPIGSCVLASSTLNEEAREIQSLVDGQKLTRSALSDFLKQFQIGTDLLTRNLRHAAELIGNFKQVAVDQASDQRRAYDLATMITELVEMLRPQFKGTQITLSLDLTAEIAMNGYPGSLGQILTNLILNAKTHAFDEKPNGHIRICSQRIDAEQVSISVSDDGIGISAKNLSRVFDPFFTTRLGKGGSGLGLHIAYNLVSGRLGGRISVCSEPGQGAEFTLEIPCVAPIATPETTPN